MGNHVEDTMTVFWFAVFSYFKCRCPYSLHCCVIHFTKSIQQMSKMYILAKKTTIQWCSSLWHFLVALRRRPWLCVFFWSQWMSCWLRVITAIYWSVQVFTSEAASDSKPLICVHNINLSKPIFVPFQNDLVLVVFKCNLCATKIFVK